MNSKPEAQPQPKPPRGLYTTDTGGRFGARSTRQARHGWVAQPSTTPTERNSTMSIPAIVVAFIVNEADEDDLERLYQALRDRSKALRSAVAASIDVGDDVVLHHISPKALNGLKGSVATISGGRADIELDVDSTDSLRWSRTRYATAVGESDHYVLRGVPLTACKTAS